MIGCLMEFGAGVFSSRGAWITFADCRGGWRMLPIGWLGIICSEPPQISFRLLSPPSGGEGPQPGSSFAVNLAPYAAVGAPGHLESVTLTAGKEVAVPVIAQCPVWIECRGATYAGEASLDMVCGEVLAVHMGGVTYGSAPRASLGRVRHFARAWRRHLNAPGALYEGSLDRDAFGCK